MPKLLLFIFLSNYAIAQKANYEIIYEQTYKYNKNSDSLEKEFFSLIINTSDKSSIYRSYNKRKSDSIYNAINSSKTFINRNNIPESKFNFLIYKDQNSGDLIYMENINTRSFGFLTKKMDNWKLIDSANIVIKGFSCKKAEINFGGRKWIATYTLDIPFQDGPYKFSGLPGLILEVFSVDNEHSFKMIEIRKTDLSISKPHFIDIKNSQKLINFKRKYIKDPSAEEKTDDLNYVNTEVIVNGQKMPISKSYEILNNEVWNFIEKYNNPIEVDDIWIN